MTPSTTARYRLGTRGSPLALAQAQTVAALLAPAGPVEIVILKTSGDRIVDRPLAEVGGKGLFTKELEEALLDHRIDLAVHSMKDVATRLPEGLMLSAVLEREDPRDRLIAAEATSLADLPAGARLGTSSLRRAAQALHVRPDLVIVPFRGNVQTRMDKLQRGEADATLLAAAGLNRLGRPGEGHAIATQEMLPAAAQGVVGIEIRVGDAALHETLRSLHHVPSWTVLAAERAFLDVLDGSCRTPVAAHARLSGAQLTMTGEVLTPDGRERVRLSAEGFASDPVTLGAALGRDVRALAHWLR